MLLRRVGKKSGLLAREIQSHFPNNFDIWIEPFFGAGGMFFSLEKECQYYLVSDSDQEVFNFFLVWRDRKEELAKAIDEMPYDENLFQYWRKNQEDEPVKKAVRFFFISNCSFLGQCDCMKTAPNNTKNVALENLETFWKRLSQNGVVISNRDCLDFIKSLGWRHAGQREKAAFVYCDPPYCSTNSDVYHQEKWTYESLVALIELLISENLRFAISEMDSDKIRIIADAYNLRIVELAKKGKLVNKAKNQEILIVNYAPQAAQAVFF